MKADRLESKTEGAVIVVIAMLALGILLPLGLSYLCAHNINEDCDTLVCRVGGMRG